MPEYTLGSYICQNSEYGKVLNLTVLSIRERYTAILICQKMHGQSSEYQILGPKYAKLLNMSGL